MGVFGCGLQLFILASTGIDSQLRGPVRVGVFVRWPLVGVIDSPVVAVSPSLSF